MRVRVVTTVIFVLALVFGCAEEPADLTIDVRTDFRPGLEFTSIQTELSSELLSESPGPDVHTETVSATAADDYFRGERVAEISDLPIGRHFVRVTLRDSDGVGIARRVVDLKLERSFALTVVITRNCREIRCPGPGDAPELTACFDARCVDPRCTTTSPELCGEPSCDSNDDCADAMGCDDARCVSGACFCAALTPDAGPTCTDEMCDDANPCTDDACDVLEGCTHTPNTAGCDDGDACTMDDACSGGVCGGAAVSCDDGNACTDDGCDPATGCTHTPRAEHATCGGPNMRCCGGSCVDIRTNRNHCSGCGQQCAAGRDCILYDGEPTCDCVANAECHGGVGQLCSTTYDLTCACTANSGCVGPQRCVDRPLSTNYCTY